MAGRIPQSFINDLLAQIDIVEVIDARMTLKKAGKNYQLRSAKKGAAMTADRSHH